MERLPFVNITEIFKEYQGAISNGGDQSIAIVSNEKTIRVYETHCWNQ